MTVVVISFTVCLLFFLGIGIASARRRKNTSDDYLLASRSVGPWVVALSAVATNKTLQIPALWHFMAGRGAHEKTYSELKSHFGFAVIPTNQRCANTAWQLISVLAMNLIRYFQITVGAKERSRTRKRTFHYVFQSIATLRFELIHQPLRLIRPKGRPALRFAISSPVRKRIERIQRELERAA